MTYGLQDTPQEYPKIMGKELEFERRQSGQNIEEPKKILMSIKKAHGTDKVK